MAALDDPTASWTIGYKTNFWHTLVPRRRGDEVPLSPSPIPITSTHGPQNATLIPSQYIIRAPGVYLPAAIPHQVEISGEAKAKADLSKLIRAHGFKPKDLGSIEECAALEWGFVKNGKPARVKSGDDVKPAW
jgi:hypothetical protein